MICKFDIMSTIVDELRINNFVGNTSIRHSHRLNEITVTLSDVNCKMGITRAISMDVIHSINPHDKVRSIISDMVNTLKEELK